jgi:hypothetical protein
VEDECGIALVAAATLRGTGNLVPPLIVPATLIACAGLGFAGGGAFRAISSREPLRSWPATGFGDGSDFIAGDELKSVAGSFAKDPEFWALPLDFSSEGRASLILSAREEVCDIVSPEWLGATGGVLSTASTVFSASRKRFPSVPPPRLNPTVILITTNKITDAKAAI